MYSVILSAILSAINGRSNAEWAMNGRLALSGEQGRNTLLTGVYAHPPYPGLERPGLCRLESPANTATLRYYSSARR